MITLPQNWKTYQRDIIHRSYKLIDYKIWEGLEKIKLNSWLKNFKTEEDQYFAACLLDSLIFRSKAQTLSLLYDLIFRIVGNHFNQVNGFEHVSNNFPRIIRELYNDPGLRLVCVKRESDPPTKSSNEMLRFMKTDFNINPNWTIEPSQIKKAKEDGVNLFIFIDDFLGTGNQFCDMYEEQKLEDLESNTYFLYSPLVAHSSGTENIKTRFPNVNICQVEKLTQQNSLFNNFFHNAYNTIPRTKYYYENFLEDHEIYVEHKYGYGSLELSYGFDHGTPDNSLPLYWFSGSNWNPLLKR